MTEHRWSKFWWQDYEGDDSLRLCSLAAQGLWMRMLCAMHRGQPYGHLSVQGAEPTPRQLALMVSATEREVAKLVPELEHAGVLSRNADGLIFSRRMVRDKEITDKAREDGRHGGNPALKRKSAPEGLTPPENPKPPETLKPEAEAEAEAERKTPSSEGVRARRVRGERLPDDWQPSDPDLPARRGHNPGDVLAKFVAHYRKATGAKGISADWDASWALWCAREAQHQHARPPLHTLPQAEQDRRILAAVGLKFDDPPTVQTLRIAQ